MFGPHKQLLLRCTGSRGAWCKLELDENRHDGLATCQLSTWQGSMIIKAIAKTLCFFLTAMLICKRVHAKNHCRSPER